MIDFSVLARISEDLTLIQQYNITNMFCSKRSRSLFQKLDLHLKKGYVIADYNDLSPEEMDMIEEGLLQKSKLKNFSKDLQKIKDEYIKIRVMNFLRTKSEEIELTSDYKSILSETFTKLSDFTKEIETEQDVYNTDDFEDHFNQIMRGELNLVSEVKTEKFTILDSFMLGLKENKTTLISAPTGMGKTTFTINVADAVSYKHKVLYINLEMDTKELYNRLLMMNSGETLGDIFSYSNLEKAGQTQKCKAIRNGHKSIRDRKDRLLISNCKAKSVDDINLLIKKYNKDKDIKLVIIDYLGILKNRTSDNSKEWQKMFDWMKELNEIRRQDKNYHLWIVSQLNRSAEDQRVVNGRASIGGSYNMLAEVDTFLTLYKHPELGYILKNGKNRGYVEGWEIQLDFHKNIQTFIELGKVDVGKYENEKNEKEGQKSGFKKNY